MSFSLAMPWSSGEEEMHNLMHVPPQDNPTASKLTAQAAFMLQKAPLLAIGTIDPEGRPWVTLWGGEPGFSQPLGSDIIGTRAIVDASNDPVVQALTGGKMGGEVISTEDPGRMVAGLAIDLMTRKRVKIFGRMVAASLGTMEIDREEPPEVWEPGLGIDRQQQLQLVTRITQSLGNCPKYLNQKRLRPALISSTLISQSSNFSSEALTLLAKADMFFISSSNFDKDMDCNHRGGPPGFIRVLSNASSGAKILYPEYSGNRLYQTLGNLQVNPVVGLTVPDYETGDVLYTTGAVDILIGQDAANFLPGSTLALMVTISEARFVHHGLPFRGISEQLSPYNPGVRLLSTEGNVRASITSSPTYEASLISKTQLSTNIARFRFRTGVEQSLEYKSGQWVALDFSKELDFGYSHMRDEDPRSLNEDWVRTFTISSPPPAISPYQTQLAEATRRDFEITIRNVGPVTSFLFRQSLHSGFEVLVRGIGGDFTIDQDQGETRLTPYIAGGLGITPLLAHLPALSLARLRLYWALRVEDLTLALDIFKQYPKLAASSSLFVTGSIGRDQTVSVFEDLEKLNVKFQKRRLWKQDLEALENQTGRALEPWYLCASKGLRTEVEAWLIGRRVIYEDFDY